MSEYIGTVGSKISVEVVLVNEYSYTDYYHNTNFIYTMKDAKDNVLVWKTTSVLMTWDKVTEENDIIGKGDTMIISGKVKEHSEYKGTKQTVLTRCKYSLVAHKPNEVEIKREKQMQSLNEGDFIWEMPYRQYKNHYADCELVAGTYDEEFHTVKVIIRKGRLKNSGTRGEHYRGYEFTSKDGKKVCYRAISEETARKRLTKEYLNSDNWECTHVYNYRDVHRIW